MSTQGQQLRAQRDRVIMGLHGIGVSMSDTAVLAGIFFPPKLTNRQIIRICNANRGRRTRAPNTEREPPPLVVDFFVSLFAHIHGWNYGYRSAVGALNDALPMLHFSQRVVLASMLRLNPAQFQIRTSGALRGLVKNGTFIAPFFGSLWQSDLNLVLGEYGVALNSIVDVGTLTWVYLAARPDKLASLTWEHANLMAVRKAGFFPDMWTTVRRGEQNSRPMCPREQLPPPADRHASPPQNA